MMWYNSIYHSHVRSAFLFLGKEPLICLRPVTVISTGNDRLAAFCIEARMIKQCATCKKWKIFTEFGKDDRHKKDGLKSRCKDCSNEYMRDYYSGNIEKYREWQHKQRWDNPEERRRKAREWRLSHIEEERENSRVWKANNPDKVNEVNRNRRALKAGNGGTITAKEWQWLKEFY